MNILSPSILAADYTKLGEQILSVETAGGTYLHIDVMDGMFVPSISLGFPVIESIRKISELVFDVHLMIEEPIRYVEKFAWAGADIITVHLEACDDIKATLEKIRKCNCKVGISIKPNTTVSELYPYLTLVDMVLIMTVEPGFGGQKLLPFTIDKVTELANYRDSHAMQFDIEVDGGVNAQNVADIRDAGANVFVAGTAVFRGDIEKNVKDFMNLLG